MEQPPPKDDSVYQEKKHPVLVLITNLFAAVKLPLPQKNKNGGAAAPSQLEEPIKIKPAEEPIKFEPADEPIKIQPAQVQNGSNKPDVVTFPRQDFVPLKLEAEAEGAERNTNPLLLWQVYAVGGIFILRWAWARWNERKGQKKPDDEPPPPPAQDQ